MGEYADIHEYVEANFSDFVYTKIMPKFRILGLTPEAHAALENSETPEEAVRVQEDAFPGSLLINADVLAVTHGYLDAESTQ